MTRLIAILLTVVTGFSGLVYEVTWQRYLATLLGSHGEATAAVLAIFLGGLAAGYALFGQATRRLAERAKIGQTEPRLLLFYALIEGGIGAYALIFPLLFGFAQQLSLLAPADAWGLGFAFDVALSSLLIGPPAVLMGGTIPILTLALAGDREHASRVHALIYGSNTAGAFAGALASAFVLIPRLGLDGVLYAMALLNILAAVGFVLLDRLGSRVDPDLAEAAPMGSMTPRSFGAYLTVALLAGFAMMALQTTLNRVGGLVFGSSQFTFATIVAVFVLCIALGSLAVSSLRTVPRWALVGSQWLLVAILFALYGQVDDTPYWGHALRALFQPVTAAFYPFHFASFLAVFLVFVIPIGLSGALLPLLFHHLRGEVGELGSVAGRLYSWNTIGSLLGALLGGYLLLFWLDLHHIYRICVAALAIEAMLLTLLVYRVPRVLTAALVLLPSLTILWLLPEWKPSQLALGLFRVHHPTPVSFQGPEAMFKARPATYIFHSDGPTNTVSVRHDAPIDGKLNRGIVNNGKSDGNLIHDFPTMSLAALIPSWLAENPRRAFVIGFGTGVTAGELAALDSVEVVEVAEIAHGVIEAASLFDEGNLHASKNPKVTIKRGDAYRSLLRTDGQYDVIVSEPSNPWVTGVEMLYSREFLEAARDRLAPGGVYAQWMYEYELDVETIRLVLRTYASVFRYVSVWFTMRNDVLLLGFDQPDHAMDLPALLQRFEQPDFRAGFARSGVENFPALLAHELIPMGVIHAANLQGDLHTLRHPILSDMAARAFFVGDQTQLPRYFDPQSAEVGIRNSLLRRHSGARRRMLPLPQLEPAAAEVCKRERYSCVALLASWRRADSGSERLEALRRKASGTIADNMTFSSVDRLLGGRPFESVSDVASFGRAQTLTKNFLRFYHYAVPFDRGVLRAAWNSCTAENCGRGRRTAEVMVGDLANSGRRLPKTLPQEVVSPTSEPAPQ